MSQRLTVSAKLAVTAGLAAFVTIAPIWAGSAWASASTANNHHTATPHKIASHKLGPLSGKWSGTYSGTFSGTFNLNWQELGKGLSGTIMISAFNDAPRSIHGTVQDGSIHFGTVGSEAITYSGSVSGDTMSGQWQIQGDGRSLGAGSWKAHQVLQAVPKSPVKLH